MKPFKCSKGHLFHLSLNYYWGECKICHLETSKNDYGSMYSCTCWDSYRFCRYCYKELSIDIFNWIKLCGQCKPYRIADTYQVDIAQSVACCIVNGYFNLNWKQYSCKGIINICLKYFWYNYQLKEFYDKHSAKLISPQLWHLRPLIKTGDIGMLKYVLNHTKSIYINSTYKTNGVFPEYCILWSIIYAYCQEYGSAYYRNSRILQICNDYNIDIDENVKNMFIKFPNNWKHKERAFDIIKALYTLHRENSKTLKIDYVDDALNKAWYDVSRWMINNNCQITDKCYSIFLRDLMVSNNLDHVTIYEHGDTCFQAIISKVRNEDDALAAMRLLYHKYNGNINLNYTADVVKKRWTDLLKWSLKHNAAVDENCWIYAIEGGSDRTTEKIFNYLYDATSNINAIVNCIDVTIKQQHWRTAEWMLQHGADLYDNCFEDIFQTQSADRYWWNIGDALLIFAKSVYERNSVVYNTKLEYYRDLIYVNNETWSMLSEWLFYLINPIQYQTIKTWINSWCQVSHIRSLIVSYLPNPTRPKTNNQKKCELI